MNVVCYERVCYEVVCYESGLFRVICHEQVSFERTPGSAQLCMELCTFRFTCAVLRKLHMEVVSAVAFRCL